MKKAININPIHNDNTSYTSNVEMPRDKYYKPAAEEKL